MTRRVLFCGPSLPDAGELLADDDIELLPPIAAGDLLGLSAGQGDVIGIVDGYFHQTRSVRHKEILAVMDDGARVLGAASLGALRAAELDTLGMEGVGRVYRDYRDGVLTADDEVTLTHGPADTRYRRMSEPLVNIRATLDAAVDAGLVPPDEARALVERLAAMPYSQRTFPRLSALAAARGLPDDMVRRLDGFCRGHAVDRKRSDAVELVHRLRETAPVAVKRSPVSRTIFLHAWQVAAAGGDAGDGAGWVADLSVLRICQALADDYPGLHRATVLRRLADECRATCGGTTGDVEDVAIAHGVHRGIYPPLDASADWSFLDGWLSGVERNHWGPRARVLAFLVRGFRVAPGIIDDLGAIGELLSRPDLVRRARRIAGYAREVNRGAADSEPGFSVAAIPSGRVVDWLCRRWHTTREELPYRVMDRGLDTVDTMVAGARPYYLLATYNPHAAALSIAEDAP
ncbi:MAG TPA: TfuA-like protein [Stackebrandtia sp.]|uniref:TfuA-like protein n=1 Tax=Stackebrandtia sp. TaxID=2023065 RepID=UPI002D42DC68|nr:TfuA-like protein [Stackebrandtia sp.]HZE41731.1 TfuA-like protein [Stackebrandtia sp.]